MHKRKVILAFAVVLLRHWPAKDEILCTYYRIFPEIFVNIFETGID